MRTPDTVRRRPALFDLGALVLFAAAIAAATGLVFAALVLLLA
ncbi:MAG: hypothetical protein N2653_09880 [Burkholderiales bacterium]|nr:hypothetical protein [Burkholderiales bacterium]